MLKPNFIFLKDLSVMQKINCKDLFKASRLCLYGEFPF